MPITNTKGVQCLYFPLTNNNYIFFLDSKLEFTSSPLTPVTVVIDRYFAINCSARNFCDIKWLKDFSLEFPFGDTPWIQLSDSKEELQLLRPNHDQKGNYTCIVTDGNVSINRTVEVFITGLLWKALNY